MDWKSPHDIMRTHKIRRAASDSGLKRSNSTSSVSSLRRKLSASTNGETENVPALQSSKSVMGVHARASSSNTKRRNPFSRDPVPSPKKRRSMLNKASEDNALTLVDPDSPLSGQQKLNADLTRKSTGNPSKLIEELEIIDSKVVTSHEEKTSSGHDDIAAVCPNHSRSQEAAILNDSLSPEEAILSRDLNEAHGNSQSKSRTPVPPVDWSLKTKMRIAVAANVNTSGKPPGIDARHVHSFVNQNLETSTEWSSLDLHQKIRRLSFHYSYPQLPWITAFPRTTAHFRSRSASVAASSEEILKSLHRDWSQSFTSVYQQLRSGICPYFYLCCHQFTVLFKCQRSKVKTSWSAQLSPSTRGLRELLTKEGISFTLPNLSGRRDKVQPDSPADGECEETTSSGREQGAEGRRPDQMVEGRPSGEKSSVSDDGLAGGGGDVTKSQSPVSLSKGGCEDPHAEDEDAEEEEDVEDHHVASLWLEGMGLDKKDFPSLEPAKVKLQQECFREIDNRPTSMIYVEGADVHPFFDFLLNYPGCTAVSGPQMGIPPTILSPVAFVGGSLTQNTVKLSTVKDNKAGDGSSWSALQVFEVCGPVLPHHTLNLPSLLSRCATTGQTTVSYSTHTPSAAFNTKHVNDPAKDKLADGWKKMTVHVSLSNPGLLEGVGDSLSAEPTLDSGQFVKDLFLSSDGFYWE